MTTPSGRTISVDASEVAALEAQGYRRQTAGEEAEQAHEQIQERRFDRFGQKLVTVGEGILRGATFGLSDALLGSDPFEREDMLQRRERHQILSGVSEIAGSLVGPGKVAAAAGRLVRGASQTVARRVLAAGIEGAVDGGLYNVGQEVSNAALTGTPLEVEKIATGFTVGAAAGGGVGLGLGALGATGRAILDRASQTQQNARKALEAGNPLLNANSKALREVGDNLSAEVRFDPVAVDDARAAFLRRRWSEIGDDFASGRRKVRDKDVEDYREYLKSLRPADVKVAKSGTLVDDVAAVNAAINKEVAAQQKALAKTQADDAAAVNVALAKTQADDAAAVNVALARTQADDAAAVNAALARVRASDTLADSPVDLALRQAMGKEAAAEAKAEARALAKVERDIAKELAAERSVAQRSFTFPGDATLVDDISPPLGAAPAPALAPEPPLARAVDDPALRATRDLRPAQVAEPPALHVTQDLRPPVQAVDDVALAPTLSGVPRTIGTPRMARGTPDEMATGAASPRARRGGHRPPKVDEEEELVAVTERPPEGMEFRMGRSFVDELGVEHPAPYLVRKSDLEAHELRLGAAEFVAHREARAAAEEAVNRFKMAQERLYEALPKGQLNLSKLVRKSPREVIDLAKRWDALTRAADNLGMNGATPGQVTNDLERLHRATRGLTPQARDAFARLDNLDDAQLAERLGVDPAEIRQLWPSSKKIVQLYDMARQGEVMVAKEVVRTAHPVQSAWGFVGEVGSSTLRRATESVLWSMVNPYVGAAFAVRQLGLVNSRLVKGAARVFQHADNAKLRRPAALTASEILASVRFSNEEENTKLPVAQRRAEELRSLAADPQKLETLTGVATAPLRLYHPDIGLRVQDHMKMRIAYYATKAPAAPNAASPLVRSRWQPSPGEVDDFAAVLRAGEDPLSLYDDITTGRIKVAAVETVRQLWPELYQAMRLEVLSQAIEAGADLPYQKRVTLSALFELELDPSTQREFVQSIQGGYMAAKEKQNQPPRQPSGAPPAPPPATKAQQLEAR